MWFRSGGSKLRIADGVMLLLSVKGVKCQTEGSAGWDQFPWVSGPWVSHHTDYHCNCPPWKRKEKKDFESVQHLPRVTRIKIRVGERPKPPNGSDWRRAWFCSPWREKHQKEKHSVPTHIVVVMTGNVRGWEISVIMFTSSFTVSLGPSVTRFHTKSPLFSVESSSNENC